MAKEKDASEPMDMKAAILEALKGLSQEELRGLLTQSGVAPTTMGMSPDSLQTIMATMRAVNQDAVKETLRMERKENPNYPERSAFHPRGKFDDFGTPQLPKVELSRRTIYCGILLGGELETEDEIELCNRFTSDRTARDGQWTAILEDKGTSRETLKIDVPAHSIDERMSLPPMTMILAELLNGAEAVNPLNMQKQIDDLKAKLEAMSGQTVPA